MKKSIMTLALMTFMAAFGSTARATTVNPAEWDFFLENHNPNFATVWASDTNVPSDDLVYDYDYTWQLNQADLQLDGTAWFSMLDFIPDTNGFGTEGNLPFDVFGLLNPLEIELAGIIDADILFGVGPEGYGEAVLRVVSFGETGGQYVTGARFGGELNVTAVPEPATVLLLGFGSLALVIKRRA